MSNKSNKNSSDSERGSLSQPVTIVPPNSEASLQNSDQNDCNGLHKERPTLSSTFMENFARRPIGQFVLKNIDHILSKVEKTLVWLDPTPPHPEGLFGPPPQNPERPLPWILFIPILIFLRSALIVSGIMSKIFRGPSITASSSIVFIQRRRRRLRYIKFVGKRSLDLTQKPQATNGVGHASHAPGRFRLTPVQVIFWPYFVGKYIFNFLGLGLNFPPSSPPPPPPASPESSENPPEKKRKLSELSEPPNGISTCTVVNEESDEEEADETLSLAEALKKDWKEETPDPDYKPSREEEEESEDNTSIDDKEEEEDTLCESSDEENRKPYDLAKCREKINSQLITSDSTLSDQPESDQTLKRRRNSKDKKPKKKEEKDKIVENENKNEIEKHDDEIKEKKEETLSSTSIESTSTIHDDSTTLDPTSIYKYISFNTDTDLDLEIKEMIIRNELFIEAEKRAFNKIHPLDLSIVNKESDSGTKPNEQDEQTQVHSAPTSLSPGKKSPKNLPRNPSRRKKEE